jgi:hypothetical protein
MSEQPFSLSVAESLSRIKSSSPPPSTNAEKKEEKPIPQLPRRQREIQRP